jgi:4-hydroxybenzoate polyprenyltransferase
MGCVYLWIWHFGLPFEGWTLLLVALSLITATGFAMLGYFINEFFDQRHDTIAGKPNRLTLLSPKMQVGLLLAAILTAFIPWLWLPNDSTSWVLIGMQVGLLLLYSLPFSRLKAIPFASNLTDMGYAYVVPLLLSFHTYALHAEGEYPSWFVPLVVTVGLVGFRNILIHQVNDVFNDRRAGIKTLPQVIGAKGTATALFILLLLESSSFVGFGMMVSSRNSSLFLLPIIFLLFCIIRTFSVKEVLSLRFLPMEKTRHLTDPFYQVYFPTIILVELLLQDEKWLLLVAVHITMLVPVPLLQQGFQKAAALIPMLRTAAWVAIVWVRHAVSCGVNYPIYWLFRLFGIDLIREEKSAARFIRSKFS